MITSENCWYKDICTLDIECNDQCPRYKCLVAMFKRSRLPEQKWSTFPLTAFDPDDIECFKQLANIKSNIVDFITKGKNIYIYSKNPGNGKTSWAIRLMSAYFGKTWQYKAFECCGIYLNVTSFLQLAKQNITNPSDEYQKLLNDLTNSDIVIWDDLGTDVLTDYEYKLLFNLVDKRLMQNKSNIYTSNMNPNECSKILHSRLASRVFGYCEIFEFKDPDKRGLDHG